MNIWPVGDVPLGRKVLARKAVKGAFKVQGIHHLDRGTIVRVVGEQGEHYEYEVEVPTLKGRWWIPVDAVQPQRRREVVRRSSGPGTGRHRRKPQGSES